MGSGKNAAALLASLAESGVFCGKKNTFNRQTVAV